MRVDKKFTPITLTIEYEEEVKFLLEILRRAQDNYNDRGLWGRRKYEDPFMQKCRYLEERLK